MPRNNSRKRRDERYWAAIERQERFIADPPVDPVRGRYPAAQIEEFLRPEDRGGQTDD